jgi:hypothetical protein
MGYGTPTLYANHWAAYVDDFSWQEFLVYANLYWSKLPKGLLHTHAGLVLLEHDAGTGSIILGSVIHALSTSL